MILPGCASLESIPYSPAQTPEAWLSIQPFIEFRLASQTITLVKPTTTIVYLLGLIALAAGVYFLRIQNGQRTRFWWV